MNFYISILSLFFSACAGESYFQYTNFAKNKNYVYEYAGNVLTGIPSSSSVYSGVQMKAIVAVSFFHVMEYGLFTLKLNNVTFSSTINEVIDPAKANFDHLEALDQKNIDLLELTIQYAVSNESKRLLWIEVDKNDEPWSLNIKKALIEMFLINITGKKSKLNPAEDQHKKHLNFAEFEPTSNGQCETFFQFIDASSEPVNGTDNFYGKVIKTRNYQNCNKAFISTHHNWERKSCATYCEKTPILSEKRMNPHSAEESECLCDDDEIEILYQQSTTTHYIECMAYPLIIKESEVVFENHGIQYLSFIKQTLSFIYTADGPVNIIDVNNAIQVSNLTFTFHPYIGSFADVFTHEIPIYNLLVPEILSQPKLFRDCVDFLTQVAEAVMEITENVNQNNGLIMTKIIRNLHHLDSFWIMKIFNRCCAISKKHLYTNTLSSVRRQLFLDAVSHVGTRNVVLWLDEVLSSTPDFGGLFPIELRQLIETLPHNVYDPTTSLIELLGKKINSYFQNQDWDSLSPFAVAYSKIIADACPNTVSLSLHEDLHPKNEKCSLRDTVKYINSLAIYLDRTQSLRGKVLLALTLARTSKSLALVNLEPYVTRRIKCLDDVSKCIFFRTTIIYSLKHLIQVESAKIRAILVPIINSAEEPYESRLAAFTVFMSAWPKNYDLELVADSFRNETNKQVIYMVRSILEETVKLTHAYQQPLAQMAREIIKTLPVIKDDGVYSQVYYKEWNSTDKSASFFVNGQFVADNMNIFPKNIHLSFGGHWQALTKSFLEVSFQQKGLSAAIIRHFDKVEEDSGEDHDKYFVDNEELFLNLFIRIYDQSSLFIMDKNTVKSSYKKLIRIVQNFVSDASADQVGFNWVRFYIPSTYTTVVPTAIGLPIAAIKQNNQIFSLRLTKTDSTYSRDVGLSSAKISFNAMPQIFTSTHSSLSIFNQRTNNCNYGVSSVSQFHAKLPMQFKLAWNFEKKIMEYAVIPVLDKVNCSSKNDNLAFIVQKGIFINTTKIYQPSKLNLDTYDALAQFVSRQIIMYFNESIKIGHPALVGSVDWEETVDWLLQKYFRVNELFNQSSPESDLPGTVNSSNDNLNWTEHRESETKDKKLRPIFLFSGIASNRLYHNAGEGCYQPGLIWIKGLAALYPRCWIRVMKLKYIQKNNSVVDYDTRVWLKDIGSTETLEYLSDEGKVGAVFAPMVEYLVENGFERNKTLFGIPQDWRKSVVDIGDLYYDTVYENLERAVTTTGQKGVLVCHSYGCLNLAELIRRKSAAAFNYKIATIITLGAPWGGSMNALRAILSGDNLKKPYFNYRIFNEIQRTHTSLYHLIPSNGTLRFENIVQLDKVNYKLSEILKVFEKAGLNGNMTRNRTNIWQAIDVFDSLDKNIDIHCHYGTNVPTLSKLQYYSTLVLVM